MEFSVLTGSPGRPREGTGSGPRRATRNRGARGKAKPTLRARRPGPGKETEPRAADTPLGRTLHGGSQHSNSSEGSGEERLDPPHPPQEGSGGRGRRGRPEMASRTDFGPPKTQTGFFPLILFCFLTLIPVGRGGIGKPVSKEELLLKMFGNPCDCKGGNTGVVPTQYSQKTDCGGKTAYLEYRSQIGGGFTQSWKCVGKPTVIPLSNGRPGRCPAGCQIATQMHSTCYREVQQCTHTDGKPYLTAVLQRTYSGTFGGDWDFSSGTGYSKYGQASCTGKVGKPVCWPATAPIHISDGAGPTDRVREEMVKTKIEEIIKQRYPPLNYHPLALPKPRGPDLNSQTNRILDATLRALNISNPGLAGDCWLCMTLGTPMPLAIPSVNTSVIKGESCTVSSPFRVQPIGFNTSACFQSSPRNDSSDLDVGFMTFAHCSSLANYSQPICPAPGQAFICGGSLAFTALPTNWTGLCVQATILPDLDIIPGDEPVPLPHLEYIAGKNKRAVQLIPLLIGLGVTGAVASGTDGLGVAVDSYAKLSNQLIDDVQALSGTINDLQDQIDSLAEVVLQNRRGLDLLTAEQGGICLALQERCCFYANKSGIVRDKIKTLQEDLIKRRRELMDNPLWSGLNGFLPYLLPLLGALTGLLLLLAVGPCVFKSLVNMIQSRTQDLRIILLRTHYQNVVGEDEGEEESRI